MQHIGHALGGVIHVALQVHQGGLLLQNAVAIAFLHGVHEGGLILVALADEHVVTDADDVGHEGHHVGRLADGLAVGDLGLLLVQVLHLQAQQVAGGGEGEAGAGGVVAEDGDAQAGIEDPGALVALAQVTQGVGHGEHSVDLVVGLVPGPVEVGLVHIVDMQSLQMACQLDGLAHSDFFSLYIFDLGGCFYLMSLPVSSWRKLVAEPSLFSGLYRPGTAAYRAAQVTRSCFQVISLGA